MAQQNMSIAAVEAMYGYNFNDSADAWLALHAAGSRVGGPDGNKILGMIGGTVLRLVIVDVLAAKGSTRDFIDKRLQSLVNTENLVKQCDLIGLTKYINTNQSQGLFVAPKTKTETFTAVLGAIYLDSGRDLKQVRAVMKTLGFGIEDLHG